MQGQNFSHLALRGFVPRGLPPLALHIRQQGAVFPSSPLFCKGYSHFVSSIHKAQFPLEQMLAPLIVQLREAELHDVFGRAPDLLLVPFGLRHHQEPLGLTALPQVKLRAAEMRLNAPRILYCFDVPVIGCESDGVF